MEKEGLYNALFSAIMKEKQNRFQKAGGAAAEQLRGNESFQPFELDVVSTNGGKRNNESESKPFPIGKGFFFYVTLLKGDEKNFAGL